MHSNGVNGVEASDKIAVRRGLRDENLRIEYSKRVLLFRHNEVEDQKKTVFGIGRQDFSAVASQFGDGGGSGSGQDSELLFEAEEALSLLTPDGQRITLPTLTPAQRERLNTILKQAQDFDHRRRIRKAANVLTAEFIQHRYDVERGSSFGNSIPLSAIDAGMELDAQIDAATGPRNIEERTRDHLFFVLGGMETRLREYYADLAAKQAIANDMKADVVALQEVLANWPAGAGTQKIDFFRTDRLEDGQLLVHEYNGVSMSRDELVQLIAELKTEANGLVAITQTDMARLQWELSQWKIANETISNMANVTHQTSKAIVNNFRS